MAGTTTIPSVKSADAAKARVVLYQSGKQVHAPANNIGLALSDPTIKNVRLYGAKADNSTDDGPAFAAAQAAAVASGNRAVRVPFGYYVVNSQINLVDNITWIFEGAIIRHTDATKKIFSGVSITRPAFLGRVTLQGTFAAGAALSAPATAAEVGLYLENVTHGLFENVFAHSFKGSGIQIGGVTGSTVYADKTHFSECSTQNCTIGIKADAGTGGEFCTWTNPFAAGCTTGIEMSAANHTIVGGIVASNTTGIKLRNGANHLHGILEGVNIAHNTVNLDILSVTLGMNINNCHIQIGSVLIENSARIVFDGGRIDVATFQVTSGANSGDNFVRNVNLPGATATFAVTGTAAKTIKFTDCFGPGNSSRVSTDALDEASIFRSTTQALTSGTDTVILFTNELCDNADAYTPATGLYVVKTAGLYDIKWNVICAGTGLTATSSFMSVELAAPATPTTFVATFPSFAAPFSTTKVCFTGSVRTALSVGHVIRFRVRVVGTSPTVNDGAYVSTATIRCVA